MKKYILLYLLYHIRRCKTRAQIGQENTKTFVHYARDGGAPCTESAEPHKTKAAFSRATPVGFSRK